MTRETTDTLADAHSNEARTTGRSLAAAGRRTRLAAAGVAVVLLVGFVLVTGLKTSEAGRLAAATATDAATPPPVEVALVGPASKTSLLTLPGETAPWYGATIYARVDGYVGKWLVDIGDPVEEGQVLATIETPELDAQLAASRAKLAANEADVQVREAEAQFAESTYRRWKESPKGVVSEQEREDKKAGFDTARARLAAARAQVALAQGEVDRLTAFETFKNVTAPFKGIITQRRIDIGNLVTAGSTTSTTPLYSLVQDDPIRVFAEVPQDAAASMKPGTAVQIITKGTAGRTYAGTIARTSNAVDPQARTLRVEADIANRDDTLVPGLYVEMAFQLASGGTTEIPAAALVFRSKGPQVAVIEGDHVAFRSVTIAEDDGSTVELAAGVRNGDRVILNISSEIVDGDKVRVNPPAGQVASSEAAER